MLKTISLSALVATAAFAAMPVMMTATPADAQVQIQLGPQQAQQPARNGAWGDRDRDGVPNAFDNNNNNRNYNNYNNRRGNGDQDHDGIPNKYDTDRDGDGRPNQWDRNPANPNRR